MNIKSTYILILIFLSTAVNVYAQRDLYNWQLTGHGGLVTFGSELELPDDVTTSYSYGIALDHRLGRAWTLGVNFMVIERPESERRWTSYAGAQLGFYWDNGFMFSERAFLAPFHRIGFGAKSVQTDIEDIDDWSNTYAFNFENGLKFRICDRISATVSLDLLFPDEITYADDITASDRNHIYKAGITYHFGMRQSSFQGPVFRTSRADDYGKAERDRQIKTENKDQQDTRSPERTTQKELKEKIVYRDMAMEKRFDQVEYRTIVEGETTSRRVIITDTIKHSQLTTADSVRIFMHFDSLYQRRRDAESGAIPKSDTAKGSYENAYMNRRYVQAESDTSEVQTLEDDVKSMEDDVQTLGDVEKTEKIDADRIEAEERAPRRKTETRDSQTYQQPENTREDKREERPDEREPQEKSTYTDQDKARQPAEIRDRDQVVRGTGQDRRDSEGGRTSDDQSDRRTDNRTTVIPIVTPGSGGSKDLEEQNRLLREQNEILRGQLNETPAPTQTTEPRQRRVDNLIIVPQGTRPAREKTSADSTKTERQLAQERDSLQAANAEMQRRYQALLQKAAYDERDSLGTDSLSRDSMSTDTTRTDTLSIRTSTLDSLEKVDTTDTLSESPASLLSDSATIREPEANKSAETVVKPAKFTASYPVVCTFGLNSQSPAQEELDRLLVVVADLKRNPETKAMLTGHTDKSGNSDYNMSLSKKRANWVRDYMVERGVNADQLDTEGKGDTEASGRFEPGERRVEIRMDN